MSGDDTHCCKVRRSLEAYGLGRMDAELTRWWTGEGGESHSLRELESRVNKRILEAALREAGADVLEGEVDNYYRLLVDDDVTEGVRTRASRRLERAGVDVDRLRSDFVSHQTIHAHLRECLSVSKSKRRTSEKRARESVAALQHRTGAVVENTLQRLSGDELDLGSFEVFVNVDVLCNECDSYHDLYDLLEAGGCDCRSATESDSPRGG